MHTALHIPPIRCTYTHGNTLMWGNIHFKKPAKKWERSVSGLPVIVCTFDGLCYLWGGQVRWWWVVGWWWWWRAWLPAGILRCGRLLPTTRRTGKIGESLTGQKQQQHHHCYHYHQQQQQIHYAK